MKGLATASIDVSDGLVADLHHICRRSGCAARIFLDRVPLSSAAEAATGNRPQLQERLLAGGDDYELLFCVPVERRPRVAGGVVWIAVIGVLLAGVVFMNVAVLRLNISLDQVGRMGPDSPCTYEGEAFQPRRRLVSGSAESGRLG